MPKLKTNKAARKRFKITATGKVLFQPAGKQHINSGKSSKRRRHMRKMRQFQSAHDPRDIRRLLLDQ